MKEDELEGSMADSGIGRIIQNSDKPEIVRLIQEHSTSNGYCSTLYGITMYKEQSGTTRVWNSDGSKHEQAFLNSLSSLCIASGKYIRVRRDNTDNFDILPNPNYELNESMRKAGIATTNLYTRTETYYKHQRNATWVIAVATIINIIVSLVPYITNISEQKAQLQQLQIEQQVSKEQIKMLQKSLFSLEKRKVDTIYLPRRS